MRLSPIYCESGIDLSRSRSKSGGGISQSPPVGLDVKDCVGTLKRVPRMSSGILGELAAITSQKNERFL